MNPGQEPAGVVAGRAREAPAHEVPGHREEMAATSAHDEEAARVLVHDVLHLVAQPPPLLREQVPSRSRGIFMRSRLTGTPCAGRDPSEAEVAVDGPEVAVEALARHRLAALAHTPRSRR